MPTISGSNMFERLSMFSSAFARKPMHVTSNRVLPPEVRALAPKSPMTDGKRIYLPELEEELSDADKEKIYKTHCLEKVVEISEGSLSFPEEEQPDFTDFENKGAASAIYQLLEGEQIRRSSRRQYEFMYEGIEDDNRLLSNFVKVANELPKKPAKKLRKYASRFSRIAQKGRVNQKNAMQYTHKIYDLFDFSAKEDEQRDLPDFLKMLMSLFGLPCLGDGKGIPIATRLEELADKRDKLIDKIMKESGLDEGKLEQALDESIFNGEITGEYTSAEGDIILERLRGDYEDTRKYVPNPNANPNQERDLKFKELVVNSNGLAEYQNIRARYSAQIESLKRLFEKLKGESFRKVKRQASGDEIDIDAAIDFMVSRRNREQPDERVYQETRRNQRDVCSAILVDMSGSMSGTKIKTARESAAILAEAMDHIGDEFAIFGFDGLYPTVQMHKIKEFDEGFNDVVKGRLGCLNSNRNNRDGAAIRYMTDYIAQMPNRTRILFNISDGHPADGHYSHAVDDTRRAVLEARDRGVRPFCITLDPGAESYIERLYGSTPYCICTDTAQLPEKAGRFYREVAF